MHEVLNLTILLLAFSSSVYSIISSFEGEKEVSVDVGGNISLKCYLDDINDTVTWIKLDNLTIENNLLLDDVRFNISSESKFLQTFSTLFINNVSRSDGGIYECQGMSTHHNTTSQVNTTRINLIVRYGPIVNVHNDSKTLITQVGEDVQLFCDVDGYPKPNVTWKRIHNPSIPKLDDIVFLGNRLSISNTKKEDHGIYSCEADNGIGQRTQWNIELQVEFPPEIVLPNSEVSQAVNYTTELVCLVQGFPNANVTWLMDNQEINNDTQYVMTSTEDVTATTRAVLKLTAVQSFDFGNYTCRADNDLGTASSTITLSESPFPVLPLVKKDGEENHTEEDDNNNGSGSFYNSSFNVTGFILGMMPPLWISFYIILHLGFRSRYAEERPEEEGGDGLDEIVWEQGFHSKY